MPKIASLSSNFRTLVFNLAVLLLVALLIPIVLGQFWRNEVVIEPIAVPEQLRVLGLTPEVASARLVDALREVDEAGGSAIDAVNVVASTDRVDFSIPDSGLSIDSFIYYVRRFFRIEETRIGGEFRCSDVACSGAGVTLRLRVNSGQTKVVQMPPMRDLTESQYFFEAAVRVLEHFEPIIAIAALVDTAPVKAEAMALGLIRGNGPHAHWAHNLLGVIKNDAGEPLIAISEFGAALTLEPEFLPAKLNLARTLATLGQPDEARELYTQVLRAELRSPRASEGLADLARAEGKLDEALEYYRKAGEYDPLSPRYFTKAGLMLLDAGGREQEGLALLQEALRVDPGDPHAFSLLATHYFSKGDYAAAEPLYRRATDYRPDDAELQSTAALNLLMLDRYEEALERLTRALNLEPDNADYRSYRAQALTGLGRHAEAQTELARAATLAPDSARIINSQAANFQKLGRKDEAIAAYRRVIDLEPEGIDATIAKLNVDILEAE